MKGHLTRLRQVQFRLSGSENVIKMKNQIIKRLSDGAIFVTLLVALTQTASARPHTPDAGSTCGLMGVACALLAMIRSRVRR